ncbi:MAG: hypothetical protein NT082_01240 [Chloroflexi bacterium]|nr:hypothetical protein [Chloroflexota bacterium]
MNCAVHSDREAVDSCVECGKAVCPECKVLYEGKTYCNACIEKKLVPSTAPVTVPAAAPGFVNTSGMGSKSSVPPDLGEWNWGGFLLTWIWGIGNNVWWSFLVFVPYLGPLVMPWVLAFKGNEWSWQNKRWESIEHFKKVQRTWMKWSLGITVVLTFLLVTILVGGAMLILWGIQQSGVQWY